MMTAFRGFAAILAVASLSFAAQPALAKAKPSAAARLALSGLQGTSDCVSRSDADGTWRQNGAGNWVRCNGSEGGGGAQTAYIIGGVAALGAIGALVAAGHGSGRPSSP